jgi:hypothetical protein
MIKVRVKTKGIKRIDDFAMELEPHLKNNKCAIHPTYNNVLMLGHVIEGQFNYDVSGFCCDTFRIEMRTILQGAKSYFLK